MRTIIEVQDMDKARMQILDAPEHVDVNEILQHIAMGVVHACKVTADAAGVEGLSILETIIGALQMGRDEFVAGLFNAEKTDMPEPQEIAEKREDMQE